MAAVREQGVRRFIVVVCCYFAVAKWRASVTFATSRAVSPRTDHWGAAGYMCGAQAACRYVYLAKATSDMSVDAQADVVSLVPDVRLVAKVGVMSLLPYALRCLFDAARGLGLACPTAWQVGFAGMWALNTIAVAVPGRYDGQNAANLDNDKPVVRFITPAGWAFAIWGPIFVGEFLAMVYLTAFAAPQLGLAPGSGLISSLATAQLGSSVAPGWCAAIAAQIGWCATFRPQLGTAGLWISTLCLGLTAFLLGGVHRVLYRLAQGKALSIFSNLLVRIPITLHFGWITCATLVNFNNWMSSNGSALSVKLAAAYSTVAVAVAVASYVSVTTRDPIFAFVVAWSLTAVYKFSERDGSPKKLRIAILCGAAACLTLMFVCILT